MYQYDAMDSRIVFERVEQFRDQVKRRLSDELTEEEFLPLRLQNGLYRQRHAYMLRVAIPYGLLSSEQLRMLGYIAREYDRDFGHFTTRQNIQYNWPELEDVPDILHHLATVEMHAIQTSGNCVRNISADHLSGVAGDEIEDPRPYCEIMRQFSTFHPEFAYLPRKFKIAFTGRLHDDAATAVHDIGFKMVRGDDDAIGFEVLVGGGLGRTPIIGKVIRPFLEKEHLLTYTEAILRVYNLHGNRKNKFKARIKILLRSLGVDAFRDLVEAEFERIKGGPNTLSQDEINRVKSYFSPPDYDLLAGADRSHLELAQQHPGFQRWLDHNVVEHKIPGYNVVFVSLKSPTLPPGDMTSSQMEAAADLADAYSFSRIRTTHDQNLVLSDVANAHLFPLWQALSEHDLATPNIGTLNDMICCPGLDFCSLANASSIPVSRAIYDTFDDLDYLYDLGTIKLKMSGCINACGHHHVGHIGILGIDKRGEEYYQIQLGGSAENDTSLGRWIGPSIAQDEVPEAIRKILLTYVDYRHEGERFLDTYRRVGVKPFNARVYDKPYQRPTAPLNEATT